MNTRSIILLGTNCISIIDERLGVKRTLDTCNERRYYYTRITPSSFDRLVNLQDKANSIVRLVPYGTTQEIEILIYWKREGRRMYHE